MMWCALQVLATYTSFNKRMAQYINIACFEIYPCCFWPLLVDCLLQKILKQFCFVYDWGNIPFAYFLILSRWFSMSTQMSNQENTGYLNRYVFWAAKESYHLIQAWIAQTGKNIFMNLVLLVMKTSVIFTCLVWSSRSKSRDEMKRLMVEIKK